MTTDDKRTDPTPALLPPAPAFSAADLARAIEHPRRREAVVSAAQDLSTMLADLAASEVGPRFLSMPERWHERWTVRCTSGHVSTCVLKSEQLGRSACLACFAPVSLTFPEDVDDPDCAARGAAYRAEAVKP